MITANTWIQPVIRGAVVMSCLTAMPALAVLHSQTFNVSGTGGRAAQAIFSTNALCVSNCVLTIQLTNTSTNNIADPIEVLTGLFFDFAGSPAVTAGTAAVAPGSTVITTSNAGVVSTLYPAGTNVGSQWAFKQGALNVGSTTYEYGISSAGLGLFGGTDLFCQDAPVNVNCPVLTAGNAGAAPDGLAFGIVPATYTGANANGGVTGRSLERSSVIFTLNSVPGDLTGALNGLRFQYGTALNEGNITVPEPSTLLLLGLGIFGLLNFRRRMA